MSLHEMTGLTPHLTELDLGHLEGHTVLGEPLPVLMSVALRTRYLSTRGELMRFACTMTAAEWAALQRAMTRVDAPRTPLQGERDAHRAAAVLIQTCQAADAVVRSLLAQPA